MIDLSMFSALAEIISRQIEHWPEHEKFLRKSMADRSPQVMATSELTASQILKLAAAEQGGLDAICEDYRFTCTDILLPEEEYFRRNGTYRLTTFEEALREVYDNPALMGRYVNGLLLSQVFWANHAASIDHLLNRYMKELPQGGDFLEIGPGHGILLHLASVARPDLARMAAWDVSPTSIEKTRRCLEIMGSAREFDLRLQNLTTVDLPTASRFDGIVISEVLEHIEKPSEALRNVRSILKPQGTAWINVPINCPAPDHLYLLESVEEAAQLVREAGFKIMEQQSFPMSGASLERARKLKLTVTCVIMAQAD